VIGLVKDPLQARKILQHLDRAGHGTEAAQPPVAKRRSPVVGEAGSPPRTGVPGPQGPRLPVATRSPRPGASGNAHMKPLSLVRDPEEG